MPRLRSPLSRGFRLAVLAALPAGLLLVCLARPVLTVDSGEVKADALVLLGGDRAKQRPLRAAELFRQGAAPQILVSGTGDCAANTQILEAHGVPARVITEDDRPISTLENAKLSVPLLRRMGAHRVIIVTSWYHSRRALACFQHFAPDIRFYSRPSYFGYPLWQWNRRRTALYIGAEFVKLPGYWVRYGVPPFVR